MTIKDPFRPDGGGNGTSPNALVDAMIGTAYQVVRTVYDNLKYIKHVSVNMGNIDIIMAEIDKINLIVANINEIVAVGANIQAVTGIYDNLSKILVIHDNLAVITKVSDNIVDVVAVGSNINDVKLLASKITVIEAVIDNLPALQAIYDKLDEILAAVRKAEEEAAKSEASAVRSETSAKASEVSNKASKKSADAAKVSEDESKKYATTATNQATNAKNDADRADKAKRDSEEIRKNLLTDIKADAVTTPYGTPAKAEYKPTTKTIHFDIPQGKDGPPNKLTVGTVTTGTYSEVSITGESPNQVMNFILERGTQGDKGWSPRWALVVHGERVLVRVIDWTGGTGNRPTDQGYITAYGYSDNPADAVDIRGPGGTATAGTMLKLQYDPNLIEGDVFDMDNMVEGTTNFLFQAEDKKDIADNKAARHSHNNKAVLDQTTAAFTVEQAALLNDTIPAQIGTFMPKSGGEFSGRIYSAHVPSDPADFARMYEVNQKQDKLTYTPLDSAGGAMTGQIDMTVPATADNHVMSKKATEEALKAYQALTAKNKANGYAGLDASGKIPLSLVPDSLLGSLTFVSVWDADANSPAIPAAASSNKGWFYIVNKAGTTNVGGITSWAVGDWVISNGTAWEKVGSTNQVTSVNNQQGNVVLTHTDVGAAPAQTATDLSAVTNRVTAVESKNTQQDTAIAAVQTDVNNKDSQMRSDLQSATASRIPMSGSDAIKGPLKTTGLIEATGRLQVKKRSDGVNSFSYYEEIDNADKIIAEIFKSTLDSNMVIRNYKPTGGHVEALFSTLGLFTAPSIKSTGDLLVGKTGSRIIEDGNIEGTRWQNNTNSFMSEWVIQQVGGAGTKAYKMGVKPSAWQQFVLPWNGPYLIFARHELYNTLTPSFVEAHDGNNWYTDIKIFSDNEKSDQYRRVSALALSLGNSDRFRMPSMINTDSWLTCIVLQLSGLY